MEILRSLLALLAGGIIGLVFGLLQNLALRRNERRQQLGQLGSGWAVIPGSAKRVATLLVALALVPIILAVWGLTALVAWNYVIICGHFPDGGGVYSSARMQSRALAVLGSLLLVADLTVTAALSGWSAMAYFHVPREHICAATITVV